MNKLYIVMYHYTRNIKYSRYPQIKGMDYPVFEKQLQFFKNNFNVVTMKQVINTFGNGGCLPDNAILLTFDDGYIDNFTVALPLLKKYKIQGSFFIPGKIIAENTLLDVNKIHFILASASVKTIKRDLLELLSQNRLGEYIGLPSNEDLYKQYSKGNRFDNADVIFIKRILQTALPKKLRLNITNELFNKYVGISEDIFSRELYLNIDQIRCMQEAGMFIGIHGYEHYWLGNISEQDMQQDIDKSLFIMDEFIDKNKWVMNYPYGSYNENVIHYIQNKGCFLGLTTEVNVANINFDDRYILPRFDCNDFPPISVNYKKL